MRKEMLNKTLVISIVMLFAGICIQPVFADDLIINKAQYAYHNPEVQRAIAVLERNIRVLNRAISPERQVQLNISLQWDSIQESVYKAICSAYFALEERFLIPYYDPSLIRYDQEHIQDDAICLSH